ncbi:MAG: LPS export ABC transporter periplasmic protein LptC [Nitrospirota bacterium]
MILYNKKVTIGLIFFLLCTLLATGVVIFTNIKSKKNTSETFFDKRSFPSTNADMTMDNFHFTQTGKDKIDWEVRAARAKLFKEENKAVLEDVEASFITPQGIKLVLKGDEGIFNTDSHDIYIRKKNNYIKITSSNGYTMQTDSLFWNNKKKMVVTEDAVLIEGPQLRVKGRGFRINALSQQLEVLADVEATIKY